MSEQKYTIDEIAEYISGWATGSFDSVQAIGQAVLLNALSQLRCDQDGIEAVLSRKKYYDQLDQAKLALQSAEKHNAELAGMLERERENHEIALERLERDLTQAREEIEQLKSQLTKTHGCVTISRNGYVQEIEQQRDDAIVETANTVNDIIGVRYQLKESLKQRDKLAEALKEETKRAEQAEKTAADYAGKACELNINAHLATEELKETKDQLDKLLEALKIIDERVLNRSDCETDLKFCGEVAFAALAAVKGGNDE